METTFMERIQSLEKIDSRKLVGLALALAQRHQPKLTVLYADVGKRFNMETFQQQGGVCIDTGIAEQNLIGVAAGMCHEGMIVVSISYGPFLSGRAFDQIRANAGEMALPLILIGSPSGLSAGGLGPLSSCIDDIALMRSIEGMTIISPADGLETIKCIHAVTMAHIPAYIRMTGKLLPAVYYEDYDFQIGKAVLLRQGQRLAVIANGAATSRAILVADRLAADGIQIAVVNCHTISPLDTQMLDRFLGFETFITVEEHSAHGGLGSAVAEYLAQKPVHPRLVRLGTPNCYHIANHYDELLDWAGLSEQSLYLEIKRQLAQ